MHPIGMGEKHRTSDSQSASSEPNATPRSRRRWRRLLVAVGAAGVACWLYLRMSAQIRALEITIEYLHATVADNDSEITELRDQLRALGYRVDDLEAARRRR